MLKKKKNIFLVGFMATGKSTLARKLAHSLSFRLIDTDTYIESKYKSTISDIISLYGTDNFRLKEHDALHEIINCENSVIATGGGLPCYYNNMDMINENGFSVYIRLPSDIIFNRLRNAVTQRPLVKGMDDRTLLNFIEQTLLEREPFYNLAHCVISSRNIKINTLLTPILEYLKS